MLLILKLAPFMTVSIIGFPFGLSGPGFLPIWKAGYIASEPELDYNNEPVFMIDARTSEGMSGSPVISRSISEKTKIRTWQWNKPPTYKLFLGVYSGRIDKELNSDLGKVWRPRVIREILENQGNEKLH